MAVAWSFPSSPSHQDFHATTTRALENGPELIESETEYPTLIAETGWTGLDREDITMDFATSCRRLLRADAERQDALAALIGATEFTERQAGWRSKLAAIEEGLLRRELSWPRRIWHSLELGRCRTIEVRVLRPHVGIGLTHLI